MHRKLLAIADWHMVIVTNDPVAVGGEIQSLP